MKLEAFRSADEAADAVVDALVAQLAPHGRKHLMVTGGKAPGPVYDRLARVDLDWSRITVTLSDDRFVPLGSPESNEQMVRERLLQGRAAAATLVPLNGDAATPDAAARAIEPAIRALLPFDAALLGMGPDGHIASLYATTAGGTEHLAFDCERLAVGVRSPGWSPYVPRVSLTCRALFDARMIVLLVAGDDKCAVIEQILADPDFAPPAAALLRQTRAPVRIIWSPDAA